MNLNEKHKDLLFKYSLGLTSQQQILQAKNLIDSNHEAAKAYANLKTALCPLETLENDSCPDELVDSTISRLSNAARVSQLRLQQLLQTEQSQKVTTKSYFWRNLGQIVAAAAVILFAAGAFLAPLRHARQKYWQTQCQMQLARIGQGLENYRDDNDGKMPAVAMSAGAPWWKVGYQGKENHSNTRHTWILAKKGYVDPIDFVCPGKRQGRVIQFDAKQAKNYNDFPARRYITYSFRIKCSKASNYCSSSQKALIADLNPIFEELPQKYTNPFMIKVNSKLLGRNSNNHNRRGQNVLFGDGRVNFNATRRIGISNDDIFTLQNVDIYKGCEMPTCETDMFLAP